MPSEDDDIIISTATHQSHRRRAVTLFPLSLKHTAKHDMAFAVGEKWAMVLAAPAA